MKCKRSREDPCAICNHYHDYEGGEPCSVCGHRLVVPESGGAGPKPPSAFPSEIIPDFLLLGSYDHASRSELLKTLGVNYILNTVPSCQNLYKNSFTYHTASASPPPLEECYEFLESVRIKGGKCLVHCMSGSSRSPSVVMYYLMRQRDWRLSESYFWVKDRRPTIAITAEDAARLQAAENSLLGAGASGFLVPIGQQPAGGMHGTHAQQVGSSMPFGSWPTVCSGATAGGTTPGGVMAFTPAPAIASVLSFTGAASGGQFVFGQQQQQQQTHQPETGGDMME